jgi:spore germination cell wall hydrolase CwlJ-like protein
VVFQQQHQPTCQFSWACTGRSVEPTDDAAWRDSLTLAATVLDRQSGLRDLTGGAKWFHATYVKPGWGNALKVSRKIARHVFYREANSEQTAEDFAEWTEDRLNDTQVAVNTRQ